MDLPIDFLCVDRTLALFFPPQVQLNFIFSSLSVCLSYVQPTAQSASPSPTDALTSPHTHTHTAVFLADSSRANFLPSRHGLLAFSFKKRLHSLLAGQFFAKHFDDQVHFTIVFGQFKPKHTHTQFVLQLFFCVCAYVRLFQLCATTLSVSHTHTHTLTIFSSILSSLWDHFFCVCLFDGSGDGDHHFFVFLYSQDRFVISGNICS